MTRVTALRGLDPATYTAHSLHGLDRIWPETNCYADLWIELLHAQGLDPHAMLPFVFAIDFEGDQWTFFKPQLADLRTLYGIDVQEMTLWRPLLDHALEHLGRGKLVSVEADAWWLPDTAGTDYRAGHSKTTIVINDVDTAARTLGYFHNGGYFRLDGEDFDQIFWLDGEIPVLPPYAELIHVDRAIVRGTDELRQLSLKLLAEHLSWRATQNPIDRFRTRFEDDLVALRQAGLPVFHKWAFAGLRQLGAAAALAAGYVRWLGPNASSSGIVEAFERIANSAKILILKSARSVNSGKELDVGETFDEMAAAWRVAMDSMSVTLNGATNKD